MYQWLDPATGITQLSGKPPPWYRSGEGGPRVFVFEHGRVIDDTGIKVPPSVRRQLRQQALLVAKQKGEAAARVLNAGGLRTAVQQSKEKGKQTSAQESKKAEKPAPAAAGSGPAEAGPPAGKQPAETPTSTAQEKAMKAVISRWEKNRTDQAKEIVGAEGAAPDAPPPPPPPGAVPVQP